MRDLNELVTVAVYRDPWDAHIARGRLHAEDMLAFVIHENHIWMQWPISQAIGGVKLQVPARMCAEAVRILTALEAGEYADLLEDYEPVFGTGPCPRCKSMDLKPIFSIGDWLSLVLLWLILTIIFPAHRHWNFCRNCSYVWDRDLKA